MPKIFLQEKDSKTSKEISTRALEAHFKIKWTDAIVAAKSNKPLSMSYQKKQPDLLIKHMGERFGYGLFAKNPIKKGDFICIYAGEYHKDPEGGSGEYTHAAEPTHPQFMAMGILPAFVNAGKCGNVARFMQHLPEEDTLTKEYTCSDPTLLPKLATSNVDRKYFKDSKTGLIIPGIFASRDIAAGEIIGFDYDELHWQAKNMQPVFFFKDGTVFEPSLGVLQNPVLTPNAFYIKVLPKNKADWDIRLTMTRENIEKMCAEYHNIIFGEDDYLTVPSETVKSAIMQGQRYLSFEGNPLPASQLNSFSATNKKEQEKSREIINQFIIRHYLNCPPYLINSKAFSDTAPRSKPIKIKTIVLSSL